MNKSCFLITICFFLILSSCKKIKVDNETTSSTDYAMISQEFMQVFTGINIASVNQKGIYNSSASLTYTSSIGQTDSLSGDTIYNSSGSFTDTTDLPVLWIKYNNCVGPDGKTRNGIIKISFTKQYNQIGSVATATLVNYSVNGLSCQGTISITRNASNSFTFNITNGVLTDNKWASKYNCSYILTLFDNGTLSNISDDYVTVLGNAHGTNRDNHIYDVTISESLKKRTDCAWICQGIASLTPAELHTRTIDFGSGNCDDIASFVIDSQTFTLHMSK